MSYKKEILYINGLIALTNIHKYKSKRKSAIAMGISVDTLNRYIAILEDNLDYKLILNSNKGCLLTSKAENIAHIFENAQDILNSIFSEQKHPEEYKGDVRVLIPLTIITNFLHLEVSCFFDAFPEIKITSLCSTDSTKITIADVDLAILIGHPNDFDKFKMIYEKEVSLGLFASSDYLKKFGYPQNLDDLCQNHRLVSKIDSEKFLSGWNDILCNSKSVCFQSNSIYPVVQVIRNGAGIGILPLSFKNHGLIHIDTINYNPKLSLCLLIKNTSQHIKSVKVVSEYYCDLLNVL